MKKERITWLEQIFAEAFRYWTPHTSIPEIHAGYYPFAGLHHTIRRRQQRIYVRVSDLLRSAPVDVHRAIAHLLVAKLLKKPSPPNYERIYQRFTEFPQVGRADEQAQRLRGAKHLSSPVGETYDLTAIFARLNRRYFKNQLAQPRLSWSRHKTKTVLGHHDETHDTIVISLTLDDENVPPYVIEFVLYHEMLHLKHPPRIVNGRRQLHTAAFRADERRFAQYEEAWGWIEARKQNS